MTLTVTTPPPTASPAPRQESGYYDAYAAFARLLRTWFVAYGIGGPVLLVNQNSLFDRLAKSGEGRTIALIFLAGVALQVLMAIVYKASMWYQYRAEYHDELKIRPCHTFSVWVAEALWLELSIDVLTLIAFSTATAIVLWNLAPAAR